MSAWSVPLMWDGCTVAVMASGRSMSREVAYRVREAGIPSIVVNSTYKLAEWADMLYAADAEWWLANPEVKNFGGLKVSVSKVKGVNHIRNSGIVGFDPDRSAVRTGGNSGYQALHIAVHAGAKRVVLCGFDMQGVHWHGRHPDGLRNTAPETYTKWIKRFELLAPILEKRGVEVLNCSTWSALTCFKFSTLEAALAESAEPAAAEPALQA